MEITKFVHEGVSKTGICKTGGAVITGGDVIILRGQGCGLKGCHCSDGYSLSIILPRTSEGIVEGIRVKFKNRQEMESKGL